ncbi:hypothetical protein IWQ62_006524, partial [Dispira parvispora]
MRFLTNCRYRIRTGTILAHSRRYTSDPKTRGSEPAWLPNPSPRSIPRISTTWSAKQSSQQSKKVAQNAGVVSQMIQTLMPSVTPDPTVDTDGYRRVTALELAQHKKIQYNTQMLVRDFIDNALYHPTYGYFSRHAHIFSPQTQIDFRSVRDSLEFMNKVGEMYHELEQPSSGSPTPRIPRQVWHTPTELFNPWYGYAIAKYLVTEYKLHLYPTEDLVIYEMGAGNGTLMVNIMDYLQEYEPEVYERTHYHIIEISSQLAEHQASRQSQRPFNTVHRGVHFINRSILEWDTPVPGHCFFLAMEVIDNFSHDLVRYDPVTEQAYQGTVLTDGRGEYQEVFEPLSDPLITRYLRLRQQTGYRSPLFHPRQRFERRLRNCLPFPPNLTKGEFLPTRTLQLFEVLRDYFPRHRLVLSDFYTLPDAIAGIDGPVVQTRYRQTMVPCSTYLVQP